MAKAAAVVAAFWAALTELGCSKRSHKNPITPTPNPTLISIETHADWIMNQISAAQGTLIDGLVKSFENPSDPYAHTFNQAQAVMALLIAHAKFPGKGYDTAALGILTALQSRQNADGSFSAGFDMNTTAGNLTAKQTGAIAFVGLAINLYTLKTGDQQFVPMGERIADYLNSIALTRPAFPGAALPNENAQALSAEENLAGYAFLDEFSSITTNIGKATTYRALAAEIRLFLESLWNDAEGRFNVGRNSGGPLNGNFQVLDTNYAADVQTAGVLALGNTSSNGLRQFTRALDPASPNSVKEILEISSSPVGIAFTSVDKSIDPNVFDAAQTSRYATALKEAVRVAPSLASSFNAEATTELQHAEAIAVTSAGVNPVTGGAATFGGVLLTSRASGPITPSWRYQAVPSLEATCEMIQAKAGVNFYRASIGATQFFKLDLRLVDLLVQKISRAWDIPLGQIGPNFNIVFNEKFIDYLSQKLKDLLTPSEKETWYPDEEDLKAIVSHHEAVVHVNLKRTLLYYTLEGTFNHRMEQLLKELNEYLEKSKTKLFDEFREYSTGDDFIEEFLAWLIGYYTYPQSARLQFNFTDRKILNHIRKLAEKHFPELKPLFEQKVLGETPQERRLHVHSMLLTDFIPTHAVDAAL